jgi:hypothetical protein
VVDDSLADKAGGAGDEDFVSHLKDSGNRIFKKRSCP